MLVGKMLYLQVLDYDRFSRHHPIGEVSLPLIDVNLARGETIWMDLQPCQIHAVRLLLSQFTKLVSTAKTLSTKSM